MKHGFNRERVNAKRCEICSHMLKPPHNANLEHINPFIMDPRGGAAVDRDTVANDAVHNTATSPQGPFVYIKSIDDNSST
jgi:hypothetical protein